MGLDGCIQENVPYITRREVRKEGGDSNVTCENVTLEGIGVTQVRDAFGKVRGRGRGVIVRWGDVLVGVLRR